MAIYFSGTNARSGGVLAAITKQLKLLNLKPVKTIQVQFDPFHPKAVTTRDFLFHISKRSILETNINCSVKTKIVCDRSEPQIDVELSDSRKIKFLANNLTVLDILQLFNKHISSKVEPEAATISQISKIERKKQKKR